MRDVAHQLIVICADCVANAIKGSGDLSMHTLIGKTRCGLGVVLLVKFSETTPGPHLVPHLTTPALHMQVWPGVVFACQKSIINFGKFSFS